MSHTEREIEREQVTARFDLKTEQRETEWACAELRRHNEKRLRSSIRIRFRDLVYPTTVKRKLKWDRITFECCVLVIRPSIKQRCWHSGPGWCCLCRRCSSLSIWPRSRSVANGKYERFNFMIFIFWLTGINYTGMWIIGRQVRWQQSRQICVQVGFITRSTIGKCKKQVIRVTNLAR